MRRLALTISLLICLKAQGQLETTHWLLNGSRLGVTPSGVNTGYPAPPATFKVTQASTSIADASGQLLFASNGNTIVDRDLSVMPALSGKDLRGGDGKTLIQQVPGTSKYLVFYAVRNNDDTPDNMSWSVKYAVVDMSLNGGKGDVISFDQTVESHSSPSYALGEGPSRGEAWLVTHRLESDSFLVYRVDAAGLSKSPVISKAGLGRSLTDFHYWDLKVSFDGKRLGGIVFRNYTNTYVVALWHVEVMDFDAATGKVYTNMASQAELSYLFSGMSVEFSPDNKLLYSVMTQRLPDFKPCGFAGGTVRQYQLCHSGSRDLGSFSSILYQDFHSRRPMLSFGRIVLGADKRIYIPYSGDTISVIQRPNKVGLNCGFVFDAVHADASNDSLPGTPQFNPTVMKWAVQNNIVSEGGCVGVPVQFACSNPRVSAHQWDFGDASSADNLSTLANPTHRYPAAGNYLVRLRLHDDQLNLDQELTDTITILDPGVRILSGYPYDTTICTPETSPYVLRPKAEKQPTRWYQLDAEGRETNIQHSDTVGITVTGTWYVELEQNSCEGCRKIDSIHVELRHVDYTPLQDKVICPGDSVRVSVVPYPGASFLWNTGSKDTAVVVTQPGPVSVRIAFAGNSCIIADTMQVLGAGNLLGALPSDTSICPGISLTLVPVSGATGMVWQDGSTGEFYRADKPGLYWVSATGRGGCVVRDSITVQYMPVAPLGLGPDLQFCKGDSALLVAGEGFLSYLWSTGDTTRTVRVHDEGTVILSARNANGCWSKDTVDVKKPYSLPLVNLGPSGERCLDASRTLDAGAGMVRYAWSTGAQTQTIVLQGPGEYAVQVVDVHGCVSADTVTITLIREAPQVQLPPDTGICKYAEFDLRPGGAFEQYLWSTGETGPVIQVRKEGVYWVRVRDALGCEGSDTMNVTRLNCFSGMHVPNAFTPGADGRNDLFRPLFDGSLAAYRFEVYDRFGHQVFATTDPDTSWDGRAHGVDKPAGTYVWVLRYQWVGGSSTVEKGKVVLIR